ncbi:MAG: aminotransferase class IV [Muribaculaceae bacterium]|nr:aminotransferase class IV [Muribaculaceae bacterium]
MPVFLESIRISDGEMMLPELHARRMHDTCIEAFGHCPLPSPDSIRVPEEFGRGEVKLRILYDDAGWRHEFAHYSPRRVCSLRCVEVPAGFDYHLKYADRSGLDALRLRRGEADEILILRDGVPCDTSYSNILLADDAGRLVIPSSCLLPGVMRRHLTESGQAEVLPVSRADLLPGNQFGFTRLLMINAMLPPHLSPCIPLECITD